MPAACSSFGGGTVSCTAWLHRGRNACAGACSKAAVFPGGTNSVRGRSGATHAASRQQRAGRPQQAPSEGRHQAPQPASSNRSASENGDVRQREGAAGCHEGWANTCLPVSSTCVSAGLARHGVEPRTPQERCYAPHTTLTTSSKSGSSRGSSRASAASTGLARPEYLRLRICATQHGSEAGCEAVKATNHDPAGMGHGLRAPGKQWRWVAEHALHCASSHKAGCTACAACTARLTVSTTSSTRHFSAFSSRSLHRFQSSSAATQPAVPRSAAAPRPPNSGAATAAARSGVQAKNAGLLEERRSSAARLTAACGTGGRPRQPGSSSHGKAWQSKHGGGFMCDSGMHGKAGARPWTLPPSWTPPHPPRPRCVPWPALGAAGRPAHRRCACAAQPPGQPPGPPEQTDGQFGVCTVGVLGSRAGTGAQQVGARAQQNPAVQQNCGNAPAAPTPRPAPPQATPAGRLASPSSAPSTHPPL